MQGVPVRPWAAGSAIALLLSLCVVPAVDSSTDRREPVSLGDNVVGMSVADLDGDGVREVVLVRVSGDQPGDGDGDPVVLEVWRDGGSRWELVDREPVVRWDAAGDHLLATDGSHDGVNVIVLDDEGTDRLVLAVAAETTEHPGGGCCLTLAEVTLESGDIHVERRSGPLDPVESLWRLDFDGDGTDELLASRWEQSDRVEDTRVSYQLVERIGPGAYRSTPIDIPEAWQPAYHAFVGDTDGVPGDDILISAGADTSLHRFFAAADGVASESVDGATSIFENGWISGGLPGGRLLVVEEDAVALFDWPRAGPVVEVGRYPTDEWAHVAVVGDGEHARVVVIQAGSGGFPAPGRTAVLDQALEVETMVPPSPVLEELWSRGAAMGEIQGVFERFHSFIGLMPGGLADGRDGVLVSGNLIAVAADGTLEVTEASPLAGVWPQGFAGGEGSWMLVGDVWSGNQEQVSLFPYFAGDVPVELVPMEAILAADPAAGVLDVTLGGAAQVATEAGLEVLAPEDGLAITVDGPPGSDVIVLRDRVIVAERSMEDGSMTAVVEPRRSSDENQAFDVAVVMVTPSGHLRRAEVAVTVLREPPELTAHSSVEPFSLSARVGGRVSQWANVSVDGREVEVNEHGAYQVEVDAPIWPRDVVVVARDLVGNETVERIEIVGFVDYRGFPWAWIVGIVTVVAGAVMFVRVPRRPDARLRPAWDDAALEEIDGDQLP